MITHCRMNRQMPISITEFIGGQATSSQFLRSQFRSPGGGSRQVSGEHLNPDAVLEPCSAANRSNLFPLRATKTRLPRSWANFEFQSHDGAIYEVDLLVLTKQGFWLVEIKSWPGKVSGDAGTWTRTHDGKTISEDNPVLLANRKAKALSSLLKSQQAVKKIRVPWLDALVFLSADGLQCELSGPAANRVVLKDRPAEESRPERKGVLTALMNREGPGVGPDCRNQIDNPVAKAIARAIEQAGIRPSCIDRTRNRTVREHSNPYGGVIP